MRQVSTKWARSLGVGVLLSTLLGSPALARRSDPPPDKEHRGCSTKDWRYVLEGSDPVPFRLCALARGDDD